MAECGFSPYYRFYCAVLHNESLSNGYHVQVFLGSNRYLLILEKCFVHSSVLQIYKEDLANHNILHIFIIYKLFNMSN